jgi:hypothetical protein
MLIKTRLTIFFTFSLISAIIINVEAKLTAKIYCFWIQKPSILDIPLSIADGLTHLNGGKNGW